MLYETGGYDHMCVSFVGDSVKQVTDASVVLKMNTRAGREDKQREAYVGNCDFPLNSQ
jgi:hypothetical protein